MSYKATYYYIWASSWKLSQCRLWRKNQMKIFPIYKKHLMILTFLLFIIISIIVPFVEGGNRVSFGELLYMFYLPTFLWFIGVIILIYSHYAIVASIILQSLVMSLFFISLFSDSEFLPILWAASFCWLYFLLIIFAMLMLRSIYKFFRRMFNKDLRNNMK